MRQELKDAPAVAKARIMPDPCIFVENGLKAETREFFSALLNTFYSAYEGNGKNSEKIEQMSNFMSYLIKGISQDEDQILLLQKTHINEQIQMEGELLAEKNRLKEEITKKK